MKIVLYCYLSDVFGYVCLSRQPNHVTLLFWLKLKDVREQMVGEGGGDLSNNGGGGVGGGGDFNNGVEYFNNRGWRTFNNGARLSICTWRGGALIIWGGVFQ